ncbi:hypothetical protein DM02DRAFT_680929 [Periconia macrospinosa]|uniref:Zn(2)-C6 fungal-type domain-containing protein n=1 Tax=Periconia macrospinosa TaxID=97972 RepID=A0A2V1DNU8_9PLEO|nr:hypothetical protein DM02DRAFT_680929 [Periconia macrospinosa]
MASEEQSKAPEHTGQAKQKRSRTGCLTCRNRRRKCDEGRPKCQNCIAKGFECRYAAAFQILGKNNFTPEVTTSVQYKDLKFISDASITTENKGDEIADGRNNEEVSHSVGVVELEDLPTTKESEQVLEFDALVSPSAERYEFALHGLLALGNGNAEPTNHQIQHATPNPEVDEIDDIQITTVVPSDPQHFSVTSAGERPDSLERTQSWASGQTDGSRMVLGASEQQAYELLKHYRYRIAPWLDMADAQQYFGSQILQRSVKSTPVKISILRLAQQSFQANIIHQINDFTMLADLPHEDTEEHSVLKPLIHVLEMTRGALADLSGFWLQAGGPASWQSTLETLIPEVRQSTAKSCIFWLMARLLQS